MKVNVNSTMAQKNTTGSISLNVLFSISAAIMALEYTSGDNSFVSFLGGLVQWATWFFSGIMVFSVIAIGSVLEALRKNPLNNTIVKKPASPTIWTIIPELALILGLFANDYKVTGIFFTLVTFLLWAAAARLRDNVGTVVDEKIRLGLI